MNDIWRDCISLCSKHGISATVVIHPHRHMDRSSAKKRAFVLRGLRRAGWPTIEIQRVCPLTKRGLRKATRRRCAVNTLHRSKPTKRPRQQRTLISRSEYRMAGLSRRNRGSSELTRHPLYQTWKGILGRCYDKDHPSYRWYGAKGIRVCSRWLNFSNFAEDVGTRPRGMWLTRVDLRGHYVPENCQWSDRRGRPRKT
jgi:hypothetical protein